MHSTSNWPNALDKSLRWQIQPPVKISQTDGKSLQTQRQILPPLKRQYIHQGNHQKVLARLRALRRPSQMLRRRTKAWIVGGRCIN